MVVSFNLLWSVEIEVITHWKQEKNLENLLFYLFFEAKSDIACVQTPPPLRKKSGYHDTIIKFKMIRIWEYYEIMK